MMNKETFFTDEEVDDLFKEFDKFDKTMKKKRPKSEGVRER